jgi:hypothetical protein
VCTQRDEVRQERESEKEKLQRKKLSFGIVCVWEMFVKCKNFWLLCGKVYHKLDGGRKFIINHSVLGRME